MSPYVSKFQLIIHAGCDLLSTIPDITFPPSADEMQTAPTNTHFYNKFIVYSSFRGGFVGVAKAEG